MDTGEELTREMAVGDGDPTGAAGNDPTLTTPDDASQDPVRWIERFAAALEARGGAPLETGLTSGPTQQRVLDIARDVAHRTIRRNAPLATFLVGSYVARRVAAGADLAAALEEASLVVSELTAQSD